MTKDTIGSLEYIFDLAEKENIPKGIFLSRSKDQIILKSLLEINLVFLAHYLEEAIIDMDLVYSLIAYRLT